MLDQDLFHDWLNSDVRQVRHCTQPNIDTGSFLYREGDPVRLSQTITFLNVPQLDEEANQSSFKRNLSASCLLAMSVQLIVTMW